MKRLFLILSSSVHSLNIFNGPRFLKRHSLIVRSEEKRGQGETGQPQVWSDLDVWSTLLHPMTDRVQRLLEMTGNGGRIGRAASLLPDLSLDGSEELMDEEGVNQTALVSIEVTVRKL